MAGRRPAGSVEESIMFSSIASRIARMGTSLGLFRCSVECGSWRPPAFRRAQAACRSGGRLASARSLLETAFVVAEEAYALRARSRKLRESTVSLG
jgi:hypothetical protein